MISPLFDRPLGPLLSMSHPEILIPDLKSSSNVSLSFAWIAGPATDPSSAPLLLTNIDSQYTPSPQRLPMSLMDNPNGDVIYGQPHIQYHDHDLMLDQFLRHHDHCQWDFVVCDVRQQYRCKLWHQIQPQSKFSYCHPYSNCIVGVFRLISSNVQLGTPRFQRRSRKLKKLQPKINQTQKCGSCGTTLAQYSNLVLIDYPSGCVTSVSCHLLSCSF